ncbi:uncharacterized protein BX663DRAFT_68740 [Cokeromyces recurvatus]|uniref:uncharacterized protein n=1 Tax=Cokeromyces recurvatus TaxID=90255 RepID=UPI00221FD645|nr:uncharacterized protein BX663DRAFT_68740 [Cokeromyces recurvatus]KAI7902759.1 hypothetical protein BX663DRAFT_68740 [Cokeromyces recurvatus]
MDCSEIEFSMDNDLISIDDDNEKCSICSVVHGVSTIDDDNEKCSICSVVHGVSTIDDDETTSLTSTLNNIIYEFSKLEGDRFSVCSTDIEANNKLSNNLLKDSIFPIPMEMCSLYNNIFDIQKRTIKPFELSTLENEIIICGMSNKNLKRSIIEIWFLSQVHNIERRILNPSWYNWVLLDLARRLSELENRILSIELINAVLIELCQRIFCKL